MNKESLHEIEIFSYCNMYIDYNGNVMVCYEK